MVALRVAFIFLFIAFAFLVSETEAAHKCHCYYGGYYSRYGRQANFEEESSAFNGERFLRVSFCGIVFWGKILLIVQFFLILPIFSHDDPFPTTINFKATRPVSVAIKFQTMTPILSS
jgi:hypothetical protein